MAIQGFALGRIPYGIASLDRTLRWRNARGRCKGGPPLRARLGAHDLC